MKISKFAVFLLAIVVALVGVNINEAKALPLDLRAFNLNILNNSFTSPATTTESDVVSVGPVRTRLTTYTAPTMFNGNNFFTYGYQLSFDANPLSFPQIDLQLAIFGWDDEPITVPGTSFQTLYDQNVVTAPVSANYFPAQSLLLWDVFDEGDNAADVPMETIGNTDVWYSSVMIAFSNDAHGWCGCRTLQKRLEIKFRGVRYL